MLQESLTWWQFEEVSLGVGRTFPVHKYCIITGKLQPTSKKPSWLHSLLYFETRILIIYVLYFFW